MKQTKCPHCEKHLGAYDPELLLLGDVLHIFPVSESTWWAGVKSGRYPKPIRLSPRRVVWRVEDIQELIKGLTN